MKHEMDTDQKQPMPRKPALALSDRDRAAFFEALVDPPEPNARLVRALADHKRRVGY